MASTTMSHLEEEIARARKAHAQRIARLKRAAAAQQKRIDAKTLALLREQHPDLHDRLAAEAAELVDAERTERSRRSRRTGPAPESAGLETAQQPSGNSPEGEASW